VKLSGHNWIGPQADRDCAERLRSMKESVGTGQCGSKEFNLEPEVRKDLSPSALQAAEPCQPITAGHRRFLT